MSEPQPNCDVAALTVQLLSAYLANNTVPAEDIPRLIRSAREALTGEPKAQSESEPVKPAVSVRKSLASPEHILSLIDGKPYKALKRHLGAHGLTPDAYRARYNLPSDYPMVAPALTEHRRDIARQIGLGRGKPSSEEISLDQANNPLAESNMHEATPPKRTPDLRGRRQRPRAAKKGLGAAGV